MPDRLANGHLQDALAAANNLHLHFAITPTGPVIEHLAGGPEAFLSRQQDSARHEVNLAALLVCLVVEEAEFGTSPEAIGPGPASPEAAWLPQTNVDRFCPETPGALHGILGPITEEGWLRASYGRSGMDMAWPLA